MHRLPLLLWAAVLAFALPAHGFYGKGSEVISIKSMKDITALKKSNFLWVLELYREGCGYCQQLTPEYEKAAVKLRKMVRIAAVDVEKNQQLAQELMQLYSFQIKGVPTIIVLKPKSKTNPTKQRIDYNGQRTGKDIANFAVSHMPDHSKRVTAASFESFQNKDLAMPKALLFTDKKTVPPLFKALSTKYLNRMSFGVVDSSNKALAEKFGAKEFPAIYAIPANKTVDSEDGGAVAFSKGKPSFVTLDFFFMDYAKKKEKSASSSSSSAKKSTTKKPKESSSTKKPAAKPKARTPGPPVPQPETKIKLKGTDLTKLRVKDLRGILARWQDTCEGCFEKEHFLERIQKLRSLYGDRDEGGSTPPKKKPTPPENPIVLKDANLEKLKVKELRGVLARWEDTCEGCVEKDDFVKRIEHLRSIHGDKEGSTEDKFIALAACENKNKDLEEELEKVKRELDTLKGQSLCLHEEL